MTNKPNTEEHQYTIYVDLDGVLADFAKQAVTIMREMHHPEFSYDELQKMGTDKKHRDLIWKTLAEYQKKHGYIVWADLELMPDAHVLWNYLKPHHPQILTAGGQPHYHAAEQKRGWVTEQFGSNVRVNVVQTAAQKGQFADQTRILIDDQMKAITPWVAAGGIGILHTSAVNTIRQLKDLGL
jgi:5'(3')-deoxyribonucleotidase